MCIRDSNRLFVFLLQLHLQRGITVRTAVTDLAVQRYIQLASRNALVVEMCIRDRDKVTLSFEVFPPKTSSSYESVAHATQEIAALRPDFMSVTYLSLIHI